MTKTEQMIAAAGFDAEPAPTVEQALRDLLEDINESEMWRDLEAGCEGDGTVIRAYRALGEELPAELGIWLAENGDEDDGDE